MTESHPRAIVIGAGPAGLATAVCLQKAGMKTRILERADTVGPAWHAHYDRLHLHTSRGRSNLPYLAFPKDAGRYPSRTDVIDYLKRYVETFALDIGFGCLVNIVKRNDGAWCVEHANGVETADIVVIATGLNATPRLPDWPGQDRFPGDILHSSAYRNPEPYDGKRVLVVGFGNSGGEIALDLAQARIDVGLCVRGPINILPKEILGIPTTSMGLLRKLFPAHAADAMTAPVVRALIGRPEDYGLRQAEKGPLRQVVEDGKIPLIDIGALSEIKAGRISVHPGIVSFDKENIRFDDGTSETFDNVILSTGYGVDLRSMLPDSADVLDATGRPRISGGATAARGLYFCSYHPSPNGQLRQASAEAMLIAKDAAQLSSV
ncbi:cation diffusion facilitator CzcD-associated flavoprotein CzcO [Primorskyibacter sedentarius]|uniref:Cation diffusion facilitator CzcD-associated flavoprotein CzcO n=1 Tax=Primorskyibacter sedentarius TaxID=745311 RepID=A0A4R3J2Y6_9RHOB|nr:NAD(P)/FAD-dependent oxidoreductase [Primorskyibacter sedentarius]TCS59038.1 cation diffusion facilitator CzcD-associated flavoprotein CzcO [Primorskyibacter sedentarius]